MSNLISLVLLRSFAERNIDQNDRLGLFLPFIEDALKGFEGCLFTPEDMQKQVSRDEGIDLPLTVIKTLLIRCKKKNILREEEGKFRRTDTPLSFSNIAAERSELEERLQVLISNIESYATDNQLQMERGARYALEVFIENNFRSLSVGQIPETCRSEQEESYSWLASFFQQELERNPDSFETLVSIVKGRAVYDAAYLPGFFQNEKMRRLVVYIDSPLIFAALGFTQEEEKKYVKEALETLRNARVICRYFDYTLDEAKKIIGAMLSNWDSPGLDKVSKFSYLRFALQKGMKKDDILMLYHNLEERIKKELNIEKEDAPSRDRRFVYDESDLAERLTDPKHSSKGLDDPRVRHDVNCIAAVLTKRQDARANTIAQSQALFVTSSPQTLSNVRRWWYETEGRPDIAPIFSLYDLANFAWLYGGAQKHSTLSKDSVLAAFSAMMKPRAEVWESALSKLKSDIDQGELTEKQALSIIVSFDTDSILAEYDHLGRFNDEETSDLAYDEALDKAKRELTEEAVSKVKAEAESRISELQDDVASKEEDLKKVENEYEKVRHERDQTQARNEQMATTLRKIATGLSYAITVVLLIGVAFLVWAALNLFVFPHLDQSPQTNSLSLAIQIGAGVLVFAVGGIVNKVLSLRLRIKSLIADRLTQQRR